MNIVVSYSGVSEMMYSQRNVDLFFLVIIDQWLKRGSFKQSSTGATVSRV